MITEVKVQQCILHNTTLTQQIITQTIWALHYGKVFVSLDWSLFL